MRNRILSSFGSKISVGGGGKEGRKLYVQQVRVFQSLKSVEGPCASESVRDSLCCFTNDRLSKVVF